MQNREHDKEKNCENEVRLTSLPLCFRKEKVSFDIGRSGNRTGTYSTTEGTTSVDDAGLRKTGALDLRMQSDPRDCWCCRLFRRPTFSPKRTFGDIPLTAMLAGGEHVATQEQCRWDRWGEGPGGGPTTFNGLQLTRPGARGGGRQKLSPGLRSALQIGVQHFS